ncbi:MAG TPA: 30S ribosomal protein S20 [Acidobacteriota bacterium]|nr:30S ribosomal protein S20 [Acidobacteriota bacterium]
MANHASALKAHRQNLKQRSRNRSARSVLKTSLKNFSERLDKGNIEEAKKSLPAVYAIIDRSHQKKALSPNAAARQKSRLTKRLNAALLKADTKANETKLMK